MRRVNEALREVLAESFHGSLSDPRLASVTITQVRSTQDLKDATVYWTLLDPAGRDAAAAGLESARGLLQSRIARELRTRKTPHLHFAYDEHQDRAERLTVLIDAVTADLPSREPDSDDHA
jgi:ribosome-binding factor A